MAFGDACADGTYSAGGTETTCSPHEATSCAPGESYTAGTDREDGRCDAYCGGTYSADGTSCINHTVLSCAPGESYTAGTDREDGRCDAYCGGNLFC